MRTIADMFAFDSRCLYRCIPCACFLRGAQAWKDKPICIYRDLQSNRRIKWSVNRQVEITPTDMLLI